jgi:hypothetical protein
MSATGLDICAFFKDAPHQRRACSKSRVPTPGEHISADYTTCLRNCRARFACSGPSRRYSLVSMPIRAGGTIPENERDGGCEAQARLAGSPGCMTQS